VTRGAFEDDLWQRIGRSGSDDPDVFLRICGQ
jgi:hypothetical protein